MNPDASHVAPLDNPAGTMMAPRGFKIPIFAAAVVCDEYHGGTLRLNSRNGFK
jgi:hypothetical protein